METTGIPKLPQLTRVPGEPKKQKEYAVSKDLSTLSRRELLDLKSRQLKLLENKSWLKKLPDKGEKIQNLYDRIVNALEYRTDVDNASKLLSTLNIGSNNLNNLEWEGSTQQNKHSEPLDVDEEQNPLEILASSNSFYKNKKIVKNTNDPNEKPLITEKDIEEAKEIEINKLHLNPVDEKICQRENLEPDHRFLPYKSTEFKSKTDESDLMKKNKIPKKRDITAATPPVILKGTVALSLRESIEAEYQHQIAMKELLEKQAAERLEVKMRELKAAGLEMSVPPKIVPRANKLSMTKYRIPPSEIDDDLLYNDVEEDKSDDSLTDEEEDS